MLKAILIIWMVNSTEIAEFTSMEACEKARQEMFRYDKETSYLTPAYQIKGICVEK